MGKVQKGLKLRDDYTKYFADRDPEVTTSTIDTSGLIQWQLEQDVSIIGNYNLIQDLSIYVDGIAGASLEYVDGSLLARDVSISDLYSQINIIDNSISFLDSSINQLFNENHIKGAINIGDGSAGVFAGITSDGSIQMRELVGVGAAVVQENGDTIEISLDASFSGEVNTASNIGTGTGIFSNKVMQDLQFKSLGSSTGDIIITSDASNIYLDTSIAETSPGGISGSVQFNDEGSFGGDTSLYYDSSNSRLGIGTIDPSVELDIHLGRVKIFDPTPFVPKLHIDISTGGFTGGVRFEISENNTDNPALSYFPVDFYSTSGRRAQLFFTNQNYVNAAFNIRPNSLGIINEDSSGQIGIMSTGSFGFFTINTGGGTLPTERLRFDWDGSLYLRSLSEIQTPKNLFYDPVSKIVSYGDPCVGSGGSGTPGGTSGSVQFNNSGSFDGDSSLYYDFSQTRLGIGTATPSESLDVSGNIKANSILYDTSFGPVSEVEGLTWWDPQELSLNIATGIGPVLQVGREFHVLVYNETGETIPDGTALRIKSAITLQDNIVPTVIKTLADNHANVAGAIMISTMDISNNSIGLATTLGRVRGVDTSSLTPGALAYLSSDTSGGITDTRPTFPNYAIPIGSALNSSTNGDFIVSVTGVINDTFDNFHNGTFREPFFFDVSTDGTTVYGTITPKNGHPFMTMLFSDGFTDLTLDPSVDLTIGTETNPQESFVYITKANKILEVSTSDWPVSEEHIKIGTVLIQDASFVFSKGVLKNHNWNDPIENSFSQGHLTHITDRMRQNHAKWHSGVAGSIFINTTPTPDDVFFSNTDGVVYQMHRHVFPVMDTSTGDHLHIVNHSTTPYIEVDNLNTQIVDALGVTLNNTSFSFVIWGSINSRGEDQLMLNLPTDSYAFNNPTSAVSDALNYSVYDIPKAFQGTGFLIGRYTFTYKNDAWVLFDSEDLRGKVPNSTAGGGAGGAGVTDFTGLSDTPSAYSSNGLNLIQINSAETALEFTNAPTVLTLDVSTINPGGEYVGIGTDNPTNTLDVSGGISAKLTQNSYPHVLYYDETSGDITYDVSVSGGAGGVSQAYVDASLAERDASLDYLFNYDAIQDASILLNLNETNQLDASIVRLDAYDAIQDVSILSNENETNQLDASIVRLDAYDAIQDASILDNENGVNQLDASIVRLDAYDAIQDASIAAAGGGVSQAYVDASLAQRDASLNFSFNYDAIQDASIIAASAGSQSYGTWDVSSYRGPGYEEGPILSSTFGRWIKTGVKTFLEFRFIVASDASSLEQVYIGNLPQDAVGNSFSKGIVFCSKGSTFFETRLITIAGDEKRFIITATPAADSSIANWLWIDASGYNVTGSIEYINDEFI